MKLHPLAELYRRAEELYEKASRQLAVLEAEISRTEKELGRILAELIERYGPGYLTVKSVRNKQGKKYRYPVWRTLEGKDIYLSGDTDASKALELRDRLRELRARYKRYRKAVWAAKTYMRQTEEYKDTCVADDGEYVPCSRRG